MSSLEFVRLINDEDATVAAVVRSALPQIARAIDVVADGLQHGGRLIYVGAGTSGRLGALDASEIPPTFNTSPRTVQYIMAGGPRALGASTEASEDDTTPAIQEMKRRKPGKHDIVLGIATSGRTPFTIAAIEYARRRGASAIALTCPVAISSRVPWNCSKPVGNHWPAPLRNRAMCPSGFKVSNQITFVGGNAIEVNGGSRHGILACDLYALGRGGGRV